MANLKTTRLVDEIDRCIADDAAAGDRLAIAALAMLTAYQARPTDANLDRLHAARMDWANARAEQARRDGIAVAWTMAAAWSLAIVAMLIALAK